MNKNLVEIALHASTHATRHCASELLYDHVVAGGVWPGVEGNLYQVYVFAPASISAHRPLAAEIKMKGIRIWELIVSK